MECPCGRGAATKCLRLQHEPTCHDLPRATLSKKMPLACEPEGGLIRLRYQNAFANIRWLDGECRARAGGKEGTPPYVMPQSQVLKVYRNREAPFSFRSPVQLL